MFLITDYVTPQELTGYVRAALMDLQVNQFTLSAQLPAKNLNDLDFRFAKGGEGLMEAATFRAFDTEAPVTNRPGVSRVSGELPPISRKIRQGEYYRLKQRNLDGEIRAAILDDAVRLVRQVEARFEKARADALVDASLSFSENGLSLTADFGRDSSMEVDADTDSVSGEYWDSTSTSPTPSPLEDLLKWQDAYVALNGSEPGQILANRKVLAILMRDPEIRNIVFPTGDTQPSLVTKQAVANALSAFGLPPISLYDAQYSVGGTATRFIDQKKILLLPANGSHDAAQLGQTFYGTTAESMEPEYSGVGAGIVAGTYHTFDPVSVWTKVSAIGMPVLANPNLAMVAKVLT
jgi:hypothetical protein